MFSLFLGGLLGFLVVRRRALAFLLGRVPRFFVFALGRHRRPLLSDGEGIQFGHFGGVFQRIPFESGSRRSRLLRSQSRLDLLTIQHLGEIGVGHNRLRQVVIRLQGGRCGPGSVERIQLGQRALRPDAEPSHVATGSQREQVQLLDVEERDTWDISEGSANSVIGAVNDARSRPHDSAPVSHLSLAGAESLAFVHLFDVAPSLQLSHQRHGFLGLLVRFHLIFYDHGNFGNFLDFVTLGHNEGGNAGGRDCRAHGEALLIGVEPVMPPAPGLGRGEHATASAHVAVSGLARTVGPAASDARNSSDGTARAPGSGRCLMTGFAAHTIWLASVLHHFIVYEADDVGPDGSFEDCRKMNLLARHDFAFLIVNGNDWTSRHFLLNYYARFF